jgi:hypothetical protein
MPTNQEVMSVNGARVPQSLIPHTACSFSERCPLSVWLASNGHVPEEPPEYKQIIDALRTEDNSITLKLNDADIGSCDVSVTNKKTKEPIIKSLVGVMADQASSNKRVAVIAINEFLRKVNTSNEFKFPKWFTIQYAVSGKRLFYHLDCLVYAVPFTWCPTKLERHGKFYDIPKEIQEASSRNVFLQLRFTGTRSPVCSNIGLFRQDGAPFRNYYGSGYNNCVRSLAYRNVPLNPEPTQLITQAIAQQGYINEFSGMHENPEDNIPTYNDVINALKEDFNDEAKGSGLWKPT